MSQTPLFKEFEKCANYSVLSTIVMTTVLAMKRFSRVPADELITKIYTSIKSRAAKA